MPNSARTDELIHASCVAVGNAAVLLIGASGSGKSALALELMAYGAVLIADDQTNLTLIDNLLVASCPTPIRGRIEARGVGILDAQSKDREIVRLVVDLDRTEKTRLPVPEHMEFLRCHVPVFSVPPGVHFAAAILQFLKGSKDPPMSKTDNTPKTAKELPTGHKLVFVTGPSGAGRSTSIKALEDIGYEVIDNLPLSLLPRLLDGAPPTRPMALGIDVRNRDFSVDALIEAIDMQTTRSDIETELLYLDCSTDVLIRRFSETRRRHPMAPAESPLAGITRELDLLRPVRNRAGILIDTTDLSPHDLRAELEGWFDTSAEKNLSVSVQSFSYKRGMPRGVDMVFDCRFLRNPYWEKPLRKLDGRTDEVADYISKDPRFPEFFDRVSGLVGMLLPAFAEEGKSHIAVAFGCTGGQHRSVALAEKLANVLAANEWRVSIRHREIERRSNG